LGVLPGQEKDGGAHADLFMLCIRVPRYGSYRKISGRAYRCKLWSGPSCGGNHE
jgi:hypothetical protein